MVEDIALSKEMILCLMHRIEDLERKLEEKSMKKIAKEENSGEALGEGKNSTEVTMQVRSHLYSESPPSALAASGESQENQHTLRASLIQRTQEQEEREANRKEQEQAHQQDHGGSSQESKEEKKQDRSAQETQ